MKYFDNFLNKEVESGLNVYNNLNKSNKTNEEIQKEKNDKFKLSLFSNLLMVVQNIIDFHFDNDFIDNFISKINDKYKLNVQILGRITNDYLKNMDKPGVKDIYLKIGKDMIDKEVKILIQYHKILISYNVHIINIKKNLTN